MKEWQLITTPAFEEEVRGIQEYIEDVLLVPETAKKQIARIFSVIKELRTMPSRNPLYKGKLWKGIEIRKAIVDNYIVFYQTDIERQEVVLLHVFYGGRNIDKLL